MKKGIFLLAMFGLLFNLLIGCSEEENQKEIIDSTPPPEVSNLTAVAEDGMVLLDWENPDKSDFALIHLYFTPETNLQQPIVVGSDFEEKDIVGLENDVEYVFTIKTLNIYGNVSEGVSVSSTPKGPDIQDPSELVDERDGNIYDVVRIGEQLWMAENLKYLPDGASFSSVDEGSHSIDFTKHYYVFDYESGGTMNDLSEDPELLANYEDYGVYYNWYAAVDLPENVVDTTSFKDYYPVQEDIQGVCPDGWHLPSDEEIQELEIFLGLSETDAAEKGYRNSNAGNALKADYSWDTNIGTDDFGFSFLGAGRWKKKFELFGGYGYLWTSSFSHFNIKEDSEGVEYAEIRAWLRYFKHSDSGTNRQNFEHFNGYNIRCINDAE